MVKRMALPSGPPDPLAAPRIPVPIVWKFCAMCFRVTCCILGSIVALQAEVLQVGLSTEYNSLLL